jgi:hypothetical protein
MWLPSGSHFNFPFPFSLRFGLIQVLMVNLSLT